ncbi:MAG: hypothetical protein PHQ27_04320 [Victivallales bacterium]|nr:hypothetical protein [Victivallales bacterium]
MLVDFTRKQTPQENLPEIPFCRTSEVLARDGRDYANFRSELAAAADFPPVAGHHAGGGSRDDHPLDILKQLL